MNYNILHSLQHMATVKIAVAVFNDNEIENLLLEERRHRRGMSHLNFNLERHQLWMQIQKKTSEIIARPPYKLLAQVCNYIHALHLEVEDWTEDHASLLHLERSKCRTSFKNILCWKSNGNINRLETAKKIVQDTNLDSNIRFLVACTYFLEDEIQDLWYKDENVSVENLRHRGTNRAVQFWMLWLREGSNYPWRLVVDYYFTYPGIDLLDIPLRLSGFLPYLSQENRVKYYVHRQRDEFLLYMRELDKTKRIELLLQFPQTAINFCLQWPHQTLFIDMVIHVESLGGEIDFENLFLSILSRIFCGLFDFDYVELLVGLWNCSPAFRKEIKGNKKHFNAMKTIVKHRLTSQSTPLATILNTCMNSE